MRALRDTYGFAVVRTKSQDSTVKLLLRLTKELNA